MRHREVKLPLHQRRKQISAPLFPDLREEYHTRSLQLRKGDTVLVRKGYFKGHEGKVTEINTKKMSVYVDGVKRDRTDGTTVNIPIKPWNVVITKLDLSDKWRKRTLEQKRKGGKEVKKK